MGLIEIEAFLKQTVGLNPFSCGAAVIERAVRERMGLNKTRDREVYSRRLKHSAPELRALAEAVLQQETWFFRDPEAFRALRQFAVAHRPDGTAAKPLRLLSLPAGCGEEAYSMVMSLLECGLTPAQFDVHAVDLQQDKGAELHPRVFGLSAFRAGNADLQRRYFQTSHDGFTVHRMVREAVAFHPGNLITGAWAANQAKFDVIFCRRFLSCFSSSAQEKLIRKIGRLLSPQGIVFVAPTEVALLTRHGIGAKKIAMTHRSPDPAGFPSSSPPWNHRRSSEGPISAERCSEPGKGSRLGQSAIQLDRRSVAAAALRNGGG